MDIEQLKLVIELIKELADGALWGFVLYLSVAYVLPYVFGMGLVFALYKFFSGWIKAAYSFGYWEELFKLSEERLSFHGVYRWEDVPRTFKAVLKKIDNKN